jgi:hypothetical protein
MVERADVEKQGPGIVTKCFLICGCVLSSLYGDICIIGG